MALSLAVLLVLLEALSWLGMKMVSARGVFYDPARITQRYDEHLATRDSRLGWPSPQRIGTTLAADGSRNDPRFPVAVQPCMSVFGDSFTWSAEVDDRSTWPSLLAGKLGCRIANYGVGGYGSDQAHLRFRLLPAAGTVVLLGHLSENILRNVNQYRNLLYPDAQYLFKPRFVLSVGRLELVAIPEIAPAEIARFHENPASYLAHEYFAPGGPAGVQAMRFPYTMSLLRGASQHYHVRANLAGTPRHAPFYEPEHPAAGLQLTAAILRAFDEEAGRRGQLPVVALLPTCHDLRVRRSGAAPVYDNLKRELTRHGVRTIDFGEEIFARIGKAPVENLFGDCSGHFNARGYALLAEITYDRLLADGDVKTALAATR